RRLRRAGARSHGHRHRFRPPSTSAVPPPFEQQKASKGDTEASRAGVTVCRPLDRPCLPTPERVRSPTLPPPSKLIRPHSAERSTFPNAPTAPPRSPPWAQSALRSPSRPTMTRSPSPATLAASRHGPPAQDLAGMGPPPRRLLARRDPLRAPARV